MPMPVRKFLVDAIEAAIAAILVVNVAIPGTLEEAKAAAVVIAAALISGCVSALRRNLPDLLAYLRGQEAPLARHRRRSPPDRLTRPPCLESLLLRQGGRFGVSGVR